jgi:hypothetical protein
MARASISVDEQGNVWGHGVLGELLDGTIWFERKEGEYHYQTFRGVHVAGRKLTSVFNVLAQQLGYTGATLLSSRASTL